MTTSEARRDPGAASGPGTPASDLILGTAGHIDHGKSALVRALTGTDPDRLREEKERGITIELGFAQLTLPDGRTMGVVDVPGHEHFVRQMISGSTGIDVCMLVIAADDGIMPQTVEHIAVIETLGIGSCVVALTKIDLVDDEWVEFMTGEVEEYLSRTSLAGSRIVPVSSKTGAGLDDLLDTLVEICRTAHHDKRGGAVRLPVDRVFTIKGAGTVVTGTLWTGTVHAGDIVEVLPRGTEVRVRSVQMHGEDAGRAGSGNRVALNLAEVDTDDIVPGDFIVTPGLTTPTDRFDASVTYLDIAGTGKPLKTGARMHVGHGTREVLGRVLLMNGRETLGDHESALAQIRLEEPLPVQAHDRFVLRSYSPVYVVGGGEVLLSHPRRTTNPTGTEATLLEAIGNHATTRAVELALETQVMPTTAGSIASLLDLDTRECTDILEDACSRGKAVSLGGGQLYTTRSVLQKLVSGIERTLIGFHADHPSDLGIAKDTLRQKIAPRLDERGFDLVIDAAVQAGKALVSGGLVGHPSSQASAASALKEMSDKVLAAITAGGVTPPDAWDITKATGLAQNQVLRAMGSLADAGDIVKISQDIAFSAGNIEACKAAVVSFLETHGQATVAELRDAMGTTRKYAVPLLEYLDSKRITKRSGDVRTLV